jgi:hypothetical protein
LIFDIGASSLTFPALDLEVAGNITVYKSVFISELFRTGPPSSANIVAALRLAALGISLSAGVQVYFAAYTLVDVSVFFPLDNPLSNA